MDESKLTEREKRLGWAAFCCPVHGFLCAAPVTFTVICGRRTPKRCAKRAQGWRGANPVKTGRMVEPKTRGRS